MAVRIADTIKQMNDADFPVAYAGDVAISNTDNTTVEEKLNELGGKTSDNNFTDAYKAQLDNLPTELDKKVDITSDKLLTDTQKAAVNTLGYQDPVGTIPQDSYGGYNVSDYINIINSGMIQGRTGEGFSFIRDKDLNTLQDVLKNKVDNDATKTLISKNIASLIEYSEENGNQYLTFDTDVVKIPGVANISYLKVPSAMDIIFTGNGNQDLGNYINDQIIDGTANLVADTQYASGTQAGVVKVYSIKGIKVDESGEIGLNVPNETAIAQRLPANSNLPITIGNLDYAVRSVRPKVIQDPPISGETYKINTIYCFAYEIYDVNIVLPSDANIGDFIQVDFYTTNTTTLNITSNSGLSDIDLTPELNTAYSLYFDYGILYYDTSNAEYVFGWRFSYAEYPHKEV